MANESLVRPAVSPNIRPSPAQPSPGADNPDNKAHIHGASGRHIDLPFSWSVSMSTSRSNETKRRVDVTRVYQKDDDGTVNRDTFMDVDVANRIWMKDGQADTRYGYARAQEADNIEIREYNVIRKNNSG
jgi:hypothetical protein